MVERTCQYCGETFKRCPSRVKIKYDKYCSRTCYQKSRLIKMKLTINDMQQIALERGGWFLSPEYFGSKIKHWWQCGTCEHVWPTRPDHITQKHWCPRCAKKAKRAVRLTIEKFQQIAMERGGWCLSPEYISYESELWFQCGKGHIWLAEPNSVKRGSWCRECSTGIGERICRVYFERIFNKEFPKTRPKWSVNPNTGWRLELDGYCKKLSIAFEYNGYQHYKPTNFHSTRSLEQTKRIDKLKKRLCIKNEIKLIEIPYHIRFKNIQKYIVDECKKRKIVLPKNIFSTDYRELDVYYSKILTQAKTDSFKNPLL